MRRSSREIIIAAVLTVAAFAFLVAAMLGGAVVTGPKVGAIAVISRGKNAGHVGIVTGIDESGNPILISGNHNNTVAEATYSRGRVIAYVWPNA